MKASTSSFLTNKTKSTIVIALLLLTFVVPALGIIGIVLMWLWNTWKTGIKIAVTLLFTFLYFFVLSAILVDSYLYVARPVQIKGESMTPNYKDGQFYLTNVLNPNEVIARGDVVVYTWADSPDSDFFKRVVGLPGERIMIQNGKVYVNGALLDESSYIPADVVTGLFEGSSVKEGEEILLPPESYFVLGDNRERSADSRVHSYITREYIKSKITFCYFRCQ